MHRHSVFPVPVQVAATPATEVGKTVAEDLISAISCAGLSEVFTDAIMAATPETSGAEKLVPILQDVEYPSEPELGVVLLVFSVEMIGWVQTVPARLPFPPGAEMPTVLP